VSGADRAVAGPHGPWRIFAAIAATVAFPVPTIRATRLMPIPAASASRTARSRLASSFGPPSGLPLLVARREPWRCPRRCVPE